MESHVWVRAASARRRVRFAGAWLREGGPVLLLAANRGAADDLVRESAAEGRGLFAVYRATPAQLAAELAAVPLAALGRAPATGLAEEALAARAVAGATAAGALSYFGPVVAYPGFPRALVRTLGELRREGIAADRLAQAGAAGGDLHALAAQYAAALERWHLADEAEVWRLAAETVRRGAHRLTRLPVLLLDVCATTRVEAELLRVLVQSAPRACVTVPAGDREAERLWSATLPETPVDLDAGKARDTALERLRHGVFVQEAPGFEAERAAAGADESVQLLAAPGEGRECIEIARRVRQLAEAGVAFDRMAVLLRDPDAMLGLLEEAFGRAGIPMCATRGTVRPDPAGRALLALLACAAEDLSASRFAEYLSLGQVPVRDETGGPRWVEVPWVPPDGEQLVFRDLLAAPPTPAAGELAEAAAPAEVPAESAVRAPRRWEQLLVDAAVVGGHERWRRRLAGLRAELRLRVRDLHEQDAKRAQLQEQIEALADLESFALPLVEQLARLRGPRTWGEWLRRLRELAVSALASPVRVLGVLAELEPMQRVGPVGLQEVRAVLEARLAFLRREPEGHRYGAVFVGTIEEARGRSFDTVFLPGLAEGLFPRRLFEDPLLLDEQRARLDARLVTRRRRAERERLLLQIAIGAAERRLVVSYPTLDLLQGRARVPSFYALDVLRATYGRLPDLDELRRRAVLATRARLGWPAPADPGDAIDAAEFDVAYLAPYLTGSRRGVVGGARFLLATNPHLRRSLRTRWKRWDANFWPADGLVDPRGAALEALQRHRLVNRSFSPTALQQYATCPYRFALYAIQRLRPREEPVPLERMDPLTRGSLLHEVQYRLFLRLREEELLPITADNRDRVTQVADETLARVAGEYEEQLAPAIPRVWQDEVRDIGIDLRGWVREVSEAGGGWVPTYFEFAFGLGEPAGRDPLSNLPEAVVLDGYRLRGSIDLVEHDPRVNRWRVTDHKTGRAPRARFLVLGRGEVLQPLLYGLAAEAHLPGEVESGRLFFCTRRGGYEVREVRISAENRLKARRTLAIIDEAIATGFLPAAPRQDDRGQPACRWCDFAIVCGPYETARLRRKKRQRLAPLLALRQVP